MAERDILSCQRKIGPHLGRRVAQPHRRDVARYNCRIGLAIEATQLNRGVQCVGIAVLEEPRQFRIAYPATHIRQIRLDAWAVESSVLQRRTPRGKGITLCTSQHTQRSKCGYYSRASRNL